MFHHALLIDDDELARSALAEQLRRAGVTQMVEAVDGISALHLIKSSPRLDLIVCDLQLPGHDAVELLTAIAASQPKAELILVSALDERILRSVAVLSRERGVRLRGALRKPIRAEVLQAVLSRPLAIADAPETLPSAALDVRRALERRELKARVQPVLRLSDDRVQSVEALARWDDRVLGAVPSAQLSRAADDKGLSAILGLRMIEHALQICADCLIEGVTVPVSVNLGVRSLHDRSLPHAIDRLLVSANLPPELLIVEVAEGASLDHADVLDVLTRLRIRGIGVALDNFGHGQASALRLQRLPLTEIKIDRSIVRCLPAGGVARAVVDFAVRLGRDLNVRTTAVGVENPEQLATLRDLGCDACQGHHLCRPLEPEALLPWIRDHAPPPPPPAAETAAAAEHVA